MDINMKKPLFCLLLIMMFSCIAARQAGAYSVTTEENGIYAELIPSHITKNVASMFKKQVRKSMKYYNKYKDEDTYTYMTKIPDDYRDFIDVAKQLGESDKVVIRNPFYIYWVDMEGGWYDYYFIAEKNQEKLCVFNIRIREDGTTVFQYDKMCNQYFSTDEYIRNNALFYRIKDVIYAETPKQISVVRDMTTVGQEMEGADPALNDALNEEGSRFYRKSYEEKKDLIFTYLKDVRAGKTVEKSNTNIKQELKEEYSEPENIVQKEEQKRGWYLYIAVFVGVLCIIISGIVIKKRKKVAK